MNTPDERLRATGSPIERDGTASEWDAECARVPLSDLGWLGLGMLGWAAVIIGVAGCFLGWWLP
jgi:hypothetical protein